VEVVGHDDEGEYAPGTENFGLTEVFLTPMTVDVITHDVLATVAKGHKVVESAGVLEA
jgi:hypothetical protein